MVWDILFLSDLILRFFHDYAVRYTSSPLKRSYLSLFLLNEVC